ncbi:MAG TPA: hypothetical protein PLX89_04905 [Verrucomicrobiota bacterium]|nr:hypothetical protein [Verrucomicrobiales bacterium]HRI12326.1 hypothetical protein [Verrucomicrobiota bacterium]
MDNLPESDKNLPKAGEAAVEAYVASYLTESELRRSWEVIESLAEESSFSPPHSANAAEHKSLVQKFLSTWWRPLSLTTGVAALVLLSISLIPLGGRTTLQLKPGGFRNSSLPPTLQIDIRNRHLQLTGAGAPFTGSLEPGTTVPGAGVVSFEVDLQTGDGSGRLQGNVQVTNSADGSPNKILGALLSGILEIRGVGTNSVEASFIP